MRTLISKLTVLLWICAVLAATAPSRTDAQNLLYNPSFELVGPWGPSTSFTGLGSGGASAADGWAVWNNSYATTTTALVPSTLSGGGSYMLHVKSNGIDNGVAQYGYSGGSDYVVTSVWVYLVSGQIGIGSGNDGQTAIDVYGSKTGQWLLLRGVDACPPVNETIIYGLKPNTEFYVDLADVENISPVHLAALSLSPATIPGSKKVTGKITLDAPAPATMIINLGSTNPAANLPYTNVPSYYANLDNNIVIIPEGVTSKTFTITTTAVTTTQSGTISAWFYQHTGTVSATLNVRPISVKSIVLTPNPVISGNSVAGTITLEAPAAPGDITVTFTSSNPAVGSLSTTTLTIPAGAQTASFSVLTTTGVTGKTTIQAAANGLSKSKTLTVN